MSRVLCIGLMFCILADSAAAQTARTSASVPVRLKPDANFPPYLTLAANTEVTIIRTDAQWLIVQFVDGDGHQRSGYVPSASVTKPIETPRAQPPASTVVASAGDTIPSAPPAAAPSPQSMPAPVSIVATGRNEPPMPPLKTPPKRGDTRVPMFVIAGGTAEGFTDPSKTRQDSTRDLTQKLRDSKFFRLVEFERDAVVTVEVLARDTKREVNGWTFVNGAAQNKSTVAVRLIAGDFMTEFEGTSGSKGMFTGYGDAAGKVAKQLNQWAEQNIQRLHELEISKADQSPTK